jgi:hypothetical protein
MQLVEGFTETVKTYVRYFDRFGQALGEPYQAMPDRQHHVHYPAEQPSNAATCLYYSVRTTREPTATSYATYNTFFDVSEPIELPQLAHVS